MTIPEVRAAVFAAAEKQEAPTWAVLLQVGIESGFNCDAVSSCGAIGPCQILPATGAQPGFGVIPVLPAALREPYTATAFLCRYLYGMKRDMDVGGGSWARAFLKYNVGPGGDVQTASAAYKRLAQAVALMEGEADPLAA